MRKYGVVFIILLFAVAALTYASEAVDGVWIKVNKLHYPDGADVHFSYKAERSGYLTLYNWDCGDRGKIKTRVIYSEVVTSGTICEHYATLTIPPCGTPDSKEYLLVVVTDVRVQLPTGKTASTFTQLKRQVRSALQALDARIWWATDFCSFGYVDEDKSEIYALSVLSGSPPRAPTDNVDTEVKGAIVDINEALKPFFDSRPTHWRTLRDENATRSDILEAFTSFLGQADSNDIVFFHFAGHGDQVLNTDPTEDESYEDPNNCDEAIMPDDTVMGEGSNKLCITGTRMSNLIIDDEIHEYFSRLSAKWAILIFESCHSGTVTMGPSSRVGSMIDDFSTRSQTLGTDSGPAILALEACQPTKNAYGLSDGSSTWFADALKKALVGQVETSTDANGDGWISLQEAFNYAKKRVGAQQGPMMCDHINQPVNIRRVSEN